MHYACDESPNRNHQNLNLKFTQKKNDVKRCVGQKLLAHHALINYRLFIFYNNAKRNKILIFLFMEILIVIE